MESAGEETISGNSTFMILATSAVALALACLCKAALKRRGGAAGAVSPHCAMFVAMGADRSIVLWSGGVQHAALPLK